MIERSTSSAGPDPLTSRLDAWGADRRVQLSEPAPRLLRQVRAVRARRLVRLAAGTFAVAATVALAFVLIPPDQQRSSGSPPVATSAAFDGPVTAWLGHSADVSGLLESLPQPSLPDTAPALPARAGDSYCAGCLDELTRI